MPRKRTDGCQKLTSAQQQEVIERFQGRKDVRDANRELAKLVLAWVIDQPISDDEFMMLFKAGGHQGEYHENPSITTARRALPQANEIPNITKRLNDTPLDYMGAIELSYVYERIQAMIEDVQQRSRDTMQKAIELYNDVGEAIRQKVLAETGHYPEEFPVPRGRITGNEKSSQFRLTDHQPPLF